MTIDDCIKHLSALGYQVEPHAFPDFWLVFFPPESNNVSCPGVYDTADLLAYAKSDWLTPHVH